MKSRRYSMRWVLVALAAALLVVCAACSGAANSGTSNSGTASSGTGSSGSSTVTVPIGFVDDLSGPDAPETASSLPGLKLAVQQINAAGLTVGGKSYQLVLDTCDAQSSSSVAASCAQKLVNDDHVVTLFGTIYPDGASTIPIAQRAGIIQFLNTSAANSVINTAGNCCIFKSYGPETSPFDLREYLFMQALKQFLPPTNSSYKTIAFLMPNLSAFVPLVATWSKDAETDGYKVVGTTFYSEGTTDFSGLLTKLETSHPDVIFEGSGNPVDDGAVLTEALNLGVGNAFDFVGVSPGIVQSAVKKPVSEPVIIDGSGTLFTSAIEAKYPAVKTFVSQITSYLGGSLPSDNPEGTLYYYNAAEMWLQAIKQVGCVPGQGASGKADACTAKIVQALLAMKDFNSVSGPIYYTAGHQLVQGVDACELLNGVSTCASVSPPKNLPAS
jgi:ABC-type branched-subunit amino acid transport system substrate-binding protein